MPKCAKCGRRGLFLKTNIYGICQNCAEIEIMKEKEEKAAFIRSINEKRKSQLLYFREHIFPMATLNEDISKTWAIWDCSVHEKDQQLNLQLQSLYEPIPLFLQKGIFFGVFTDWAGNKFFETTLSSCTCPDYIKTRLPCQHIYRLFHELISIEDKISSIIDVPNHIINSFSSLTFEQKRDFIFQIRHMPDVGRDIFLTDCLNFEIEAGLLISSSPISYEAVLSKKTKDEIILALAKRNIHDFRPSWSKVRIIDWVLENHQAFLKKYFKNYIHIAMPQDIQNWSQGVKALFKSYSPVHPRSWYECCPK